MELETYRKAKKLVEEIEDLKSYINIYEHMIMDDKVSKERKAKINGDLTRLYVDLADKEDEFRNL